MCVEALWIQLTVELYPTVAVQVYSLHDILKEGIRVLESCGASATRPGKRVQVHTVVQLLQALPEPIYTQGTLLVRIQRGP